MDPGDFPAFEARGQETYDRLVVMLGGSTNERLRKDGSWLRRLMWPYFCGSRVYDPMWCKRDGTSQPEWLRLDVRSGDRLMEILFEDDPFRFTIHCDGGLVLRSRFPTDLKNVFLDALLGAERIDPETAVDTLDLFGSILTDLKKFDTGADPWAPDRPPRRHVETRDELLLRNI